MTLHYSSRRALYDSLGRVRVNLDLNFGRWEYRYDDAGQLVGTTSPTGHVAEYRYDKAGRLMAESLDGQLEAEYFYDRYPGDGALGLDNNPEWAGYPDWAFTPERPVAVRDRSGVSITAANFGTRSESWKQVYPSDRLYHFETVANGAGELIYARDPDGVDATASYYPDGTLMSTYWDGHLVVKEVKVNFMGQTELTQYGDAAQTMAWTGYNPVTHQPMNTVVQQQNRVYQEGGDSHKMTLLAFGYQYDKVGKLTGISDWRGRAMGETAKLGLDTWHPTGHTRQMIGSHYSAYPGSFDPDMKGPIQWNAGDIANGNTDTGWPVGATPSDAVFHYDTLYQLTGEDREYVTGSGADSQLDAKNEIVQERVKNLYWDFNTLGSMTGWTEGVDSAGNTAAENLGRALGTIVNGYELNRATGCDMNALANSSALPSGCYKTDALYFASNVDEVQPGQATCVWAQYDVAGQMTRQIIRKGCASCSFEAGPEGADCPGFDEQGTPGTPGYQKRVDGERIDYEYTWNGRGQLAGAIKREDGSHTITMAYLYDASGARVVREKSDVAGGQIDAIRQDLYIAGGYERRQVQLVNESTGNPAGIYAAAFRGTQPLSVGTRGVYSNVEASRKVKYSSGLRVEQDFKEGTFGPQKRFLSIGNHLGSTSSVIDYDTGALVEWNTHYAYGADESRWKNGDEKYDNNEEPYGFTGKEEDKAVGLHYFGARYYSSYIGRWLSANPPVVHQGGATNYYNYGANT